MRRLPVLYPVLLLLLTLAAPAAAQTKEPLGLFVVDARVTLPGYKGSASVATALGVDELDLPTRGLGLAFGVHLYPLRKGVVTLGVGGELMASRRSSTEKTTDGTAGATVQTRLSSLSPQISLNFGSRQGWSYISGGLGSGRYTTELKGSPPADDAGRVRALNYGGGARWFLNPHLAVSLDLRFYAVNAQDATASRPAFPRMTVVAFTGGIALK